ncbi:DUF6263 family protein [Solitalea lacus]|uniref:DUF6263 family protein n=1 Tax=Solitalea lacus TaxID=2911172 RepID=UPI001EDC4627|nr:DUF6263 family protein [Solitalea lacus]UKJ08083.1 DUF6263 family protein [Solitalea lacus]
MKKKLLMLITAGILTITYAFAQKAIILKQNFQVGKKYSYAMLLNQNINQDIMGQKIDLKQVMDMTYSFAVNKTQGDNKDIKVVYEKVYSLTEAMGNSNEYDSSKDDGTSKNPLSAMKGAGFNMLLSSKGEVKSVTGVDKMIDAMIQKVSSDSATAQTLKETLKKQFGNEAIKTSMENALKIYPDHPVKIGDSWEVQTEVKAALPMTMKTVYTLKELKNNKAIIGISGTIGANGPAEIMGFSMQTNLTGTNIGDMIVDVKSGLPLTSNIKLNINGTLNAMGQDIKMKIEGENKISAKEL